MKTAKTVIQIRKVGPSTAQAVNSGDASILRQLFGTDTIDTVTRELLRDLSRGLISFEIVP